MHESYVIKAGFAVMLAGIAVMTIRAPRAAFEQKDYQFVKKVSQETLYKVEAAKIAQSHAKSPSVRKYGVIAARENQNVNRKLESLADATEVPIDSALNEEFSQRLDKLKSVPPAQFDDYYVADMKELHSEDQDLLEQEAQDGSDAYKPFANETAEMVREQLDRLAAL